MTIGGAALAALGAGGLVLLNSGAAAQDGTAPVTAEGTAAPVKTTEPAAPTAPGAAVIPAGTILVIQLDAPVTSRSATRGDMFPISLAEPVRLNDAEVIPAGISGEGQVVHSAGTGFGGRAGELIVAARYLTWGDRRIALRGMRISTAGRTATVEALAVSAVIPLGGLFVTGTSVDLPAGQIAVARLVDDLPLMGQVDPVVPAPPTERPQTEVQQGE